MFFQLNSSVVVTAGGLRLEEGTDFTVNYSMGKVNIINEGILMSGTPIRISVESNTLDYNKNLSWCTRLSCCW